MTALLAGIDWSSKAIHAALIPLDADHGDPLCPPVTFRCEELPGLQGDATLRIRAVRQAIRALLADIETWPSDYPGAVESVWVEECWGNHRNTDRALLPIYGAIVASVPTHIPVAGISAREWRKELGLYINLTKAAALEEATEAIWQMTYPRPAAWIVQNLDEHYADALLVALAGRQIMHRHAGAAA